jgi:hypothetical protein
MAALAVYLTGEALGALAPDTQTWATWVRRAWLAPSLAMPIWVLLTLGLAAEDGPPDLAHRVRQAFGPLAVLLAGMGVLFGVLGSGTTLVADWTAAFAVEGAFRVGPAAQRHVPAGPLLPSYQAFALVCLAWASLNMLVLWKSSAPGTPLRARFAWLLGSATSFVVGGAWIVIGSGVYELAGLPGQMLLVVGILVMGWNIGRYGALLAGEQVTGDFLAFSASMLAIVAIYGAVILVLAPNYNWIERALPLLLLVMTTHVVVDTRGHLLDRIVYEPLMGRLRGQLRELANRVVRQPDSLTALADVRDTVDQILRDSVAEASASPVQTQSTEVAELRVLVEGALRRLNDLPALSQHPLSEKLGLDRSGTPLERAARLRQGLDQAIERLRPPGARPTPGSSNVGGWLHYLVLKEAYADGRPNKQIMQRYALSEGTFHRARRRAIDVLATEILERVRERGRPNVEGVPP